MENWNPAIVYQLATERHRENAARGAQAQELATLFGAPTARVRLAATFAALAAWLDPALAAVRPVIARGGA